IENDGVQAHASGARRPLRPGAVAAEAGKLLPVLPAVGSAEDGGVFDARVNRIRIGERWLQVPHPLELPGMLGAIVKLVGGEGLAGFRGSVVNELVARAGRHNAGLWQGFTAGR